MIFVYCRKTDFTDKKMAAREPTKMEGKGFFEETRERLDARDPQTIGILVALLVGTQTVQFRN